MRKSPSIGASPSMDSKYLPSNGSANGSPKENGHAASVTAESPKSTTSPVLVKNGSAKKNGTTPLKESNGTTPKQQQNNTSPLKPVVQIGGIVSEPVNLNKTKESGSPAKSGSPRSKAAEKMPKKSSSGPQTVYEKWGSIEVEPGVRCSNLCSPQNPVISTPSDAVNAKTTWDGFLHGLEISRNGNCLGWRSGDSYQWFSYQDVYDRVRQICWAFKTKTPSLARQSFVGIYAASVPNWVVCSLAINARSMCIVPLYDTLGAESCSYIINQVEMKVMFVDTAVAAGRIIDAIDTTPTLKTLICFQQDVDQALMDKAKAASVTLFTLNDFMAGSDEKDTDVFDVPTDEDIAMVQYTSGTTGFPKGVVQTHRAYVANFTGVDYPFTAKLDPAFSFSSKDVCLQFLPLAHAYAQIVCTWFLYHGAQIGFFGGNVLKLLEDATLLKPTFMPMVPRLMNRLYGKVKSEVGSSGLKAKMFWYCYERKRELVRKGTITRDSVWDMIAFRKIQRLLGGNVRIMSVGSAPISAEVLEFWRVCFGALIVEGYGQTECTAVATIAIGPAGGNVGHPLVCNLIKLADAPDCGYFVKDGKGEVCIKGPNVMSGYYKQPDKTAEALDADGWLHTGDIGMFLEDGSLKIFDRKKHIFKLAQGEYIAPEKIENIYAMCPLVAQCFVDGSSLESFTIAVVVPDPTATETWAKANNVSADSVMTNQEFLKYVLKELHAVGKENKLNSLEQVKNIYCTADAFTASNGLLTPSMKNKRPELRKYFKDQIDAMYKAGPLNGQAN